MAGGKKGTLIIIGGAEGKIGNKAILEEVAAKG
jgi:cyanophycinase-like exopeptidase